MNVGHLKYKMIIDNLNETRIYIPSKQRCRTFRPYYQFGHRRLFMCYVLLL